MNTPESYESQRRYLTEGCDQALRLGLFDADPGLRLAATGCDETGRDQLLVGGGQLVVLRYFDDDPDEVIVRTKIRSIEVVAGVGLQLRSASKTWQHRVPDSVASVLRELLIESPIWEPRGRAGHLIFEQSWKHRQLAQLVGQVVMRAAEAEHSLSSLAAHTSGEASDRLIYGKTGRELSEHLEKIGARSCAIRDLAERYKAWSERRNQLVHSIRPLEEGGGPGPETVRVILQKKGENFDPRYSVETQDLADVVDIWQAFTFLLSDVQQIFGSLFEGITVKNLPVSTSFAEFRRLP